MKKNDIIFENYLNTICGFVDTPPTIYDICDDIKIIAFYNEPEKNNSVFFSYGLSSMQKDDWIYSKPEMILCVESLEKDWGITMGKIIMKVSAELSFTYGDLFYWERPISHDTYMDSFFVFANSLIDEEDSYINLADRKIHFSEMYPFYEPEKEIIYRIGVEKFFMLKEYDRFNVKRKMLDVKKFCN